MSKFLPAGGFRRINLEFDLNNYTNNSSKGCVLEVDLDYPKKFHHLHKSKKRCCLVIS